MISSIIASADNKVFGLPVLDLKVGDPVPTEYEWASIFIDQHLAAHLLGKNHSSNRALTAARLRSVTSDIAAKRWHLTPASIVFSDAGVLLDGQNRLTAIRDTGEAIWSVVTFGWPEDTMNHLDITSKRTGADILTIHGCKHPAIVSAAISRYVRYGEVINKDVQISHNLISTPEMEAIFQKAPSLWQEAGEAGVALYRALGRGLNPTLFALVYFLIEEVNPGTAGDFYEEIAKGTGTPESATRAIQTRYLNTPYKPSEFKDRRLPIEALIRAYNTYRGGKRYVYPRTDGFRTSVIAPKP